MASDNAKGKANETVEVTATTALHDGNPEPAYESGPHLDDPDIRAAKRKQMVDHGWDDETDGLTDEMAAILKEKGE